MHPRLPVLALTLALAATSVTATAPASASAPTGNILAWGDRNPANDHETYEGTFGDNYFGQQDIPGSLAGKTITAVSASLRNSAALTADGVVTTWGDPGLLGAETATPASLAGKEVTQVSAGTGFFVALTSDGAVTAWGLDSLGQTDVPAELAGKVVVKVAAGLRHALALTSDGVVHAWGQGVSGSTTVPVAAQGNVVDIDAGHDTSIAVTADHQLVFWGDDLGGLMTPPAGYSSLGATTARLGESQGVVLDETGTVHAWGWNSFDAATVPAALTGRTVVAVDSGGRMSAAATSEGTVVSWGYDGYTYDGSGTGTPDTDNTAYVPPPVPGQQITSVAVGEEHVLAVVKPGIQGLAAPDIVGATQVGSLLTATPGVVLPGGTTPGYQWLRNGVPVAGAVGSTYRLGRADFDTRMSVVVTSSRTGFDGLVRTSTPTSTVTAAVSALSLRGTASRGRRVRLTGTVTAAGLAAAQLSGPCSVYRGRPGGAVRRVAGCQVIRGSVAVTVKRQPTGRLVYQLRFTGTPSVALPSRSRPLRLRVRA